MEFQKDIDLAYVLMHDLDNGILIKSQDKAGSIKSQEVLTKLNALNAYCNNLQRTIKAKLVRGRFQKEVELPLLKIIRKYKYLTRNYKIKALLKILNIRNLLQRELLKKLFFWKTIFNPIGLRM